MEKKQLKMYEAPAVETIDLEAKVALLAGSDTTESGGWEVPVPEDE